MAPAAPGSFLNSCWFFNLAEANFKANNLQFFLCVYKLQGDPLVDLWKGLSLHSNDNGSVFGIQSPMRICEFCNKLGPLCCIKNDFPPIGNWQLIGYKSLPPPNLLQKVVFLTASTFSVVYGWPNIAVK